MSVISTGKYHARHNVKRAIDRNLGHQNQLCLEMITLRPFLFPRSLMETHKQILSALLVRRLLLSIYTQVTHCVVLPPRSGHHRSGQRSTSHLAVPSIPFHPFPTTAKSAITNPTPTSASSSSDQVFSFLLYC